MSQATAPALRDLANEAPVLCATLGASAALGVYAALPLRLPFSAHPILMMLAFATVSSVAIAAKQQRAGRRNTLTHAYAMVIAASLAIGGWYSIWRQKELLGKPHNTSWHSLTGLAVLSATLSSAACARCSYSTQTSAVRQRAWACVACIASPPRSPPRSHSPPSSVAGPSSRRPHRRLR